MENPRQETQKVPQVSEVVASMEIKKPRRICRIRGLEAYTKEDLKKAVKLLALALVFPVSVLVMSWLDSLLFGGPLIQYVVGTAIEIGGVLAGVIIGYFIWGMKEVDA